MSTRKDTEKLNNFIYNIENIIYSERILHLLIQNFSKLLSFLTDYKIKIEIKLILLNQNDLLILIWSKNEYHIIILNEFV